MDNSIRLVWYRSCRNDGISALKLRWLCRKIDWLLFLYCVYLYIRPETFGTTLVGLYLNHNSLKYTTPLSLQPTLLATLALFSTNSLPSLTKSLHFLNLATITFVNFDVLVCFKLFIIFIAIAITCCLWPSPTTPRYWCTDGLHWLPVAARRLSSSSSNVSWYTKR